MRRHSFLALIICFASWSLAKAQQGAPPREMAPQSDQSAQTAPKRPTKPSEVERITVEELKAKLAKGEPLTILDVRVGPSYEASDQTIKGAIRIAPDEIEKHLSELPKDREIVTFCT